MDKFFGHFGRIGFFSLVVVSWIDEFFSTGDYLSNYWIFYGMVCMYLWFDYKMSLTNVTRHIVQYEDKNET